MIVQASVGSVLAVRIPLDSLRRLSNLPGVEFIEGSRMAYPLNDAGVPATGADGSGAVVGILDTGVDFTHPDFIKPDGTTRIKFLCDQSDPPQVGDQTCAAHAGPTAGTLWTEAQINASLPGGGPVRQTDTDGHGTHVLGSAAGDDATYGGMAPGADLIVVNGGSGFSTNEQIAAIDFIDARAAELGLPYVINMSLGGHIGPHDGTDLVSQAISDEFGAGKPGKAIVVAGGNDGGDNIHTDGNVSSGPQTRTFTVNPGASAVFVDLWYDGSDSFSFAFQDRDGLGNSGIVSGNFPSGCRSGTNTCVDVSHFGPSTGNGDIEVFMAIYPANSAAPIDVTGTWTITLTGSVINEGTFDAWIVCSGTHCDFDAGDDQLTVGQPGVAADAITVGSYTTKGTWLSIDGNEYCLCSPPTIPVPTVGEISSFSSRGPTRDGRQKPDITAPGELIASTLSADHAEIEPFIVPSNRHSIKQGTSMATPHVAGAVALLLGENPTLDAAEIKALLQGHAVLDGFTSGACDNAWGCGKLNIANISLGQVGAPALTAPADGATLAIGRPLFDWEPSTGDVADYRLVVSGDSAGPAAASNGDVVLDVVVAHPTTSFEATGDLADGAYSWRVTATDGGSNRAHSETRSFTIDTTPPGAPGLGGLERNTPPDNSYVKAPRPFFEWMLSTGDVADYRLVVSGDVPVVDVVVTHPTTSFQVTGDLADGVYTWRVTARDTVLNQAHSPTRSFTIDTLPPGVPFLVAPADQALITDPTPLFVWTPSTGDVVEYELIVEGSGLIYKLLSPPITSFQPTGDLADGTWHWRVGARDLARNFASDGLRFFTIDTVPPGAPSQLAPGDQSLITDPTPLFDWGPSTGDVADYRLLVTSGDIDAGPYAIDAIVVHPATDFQPTGDLQNAGYSWRETARDAALNQAHSEVATFTLDTVPPDPPGMLFPGSGDSVAGGFDFTWTTAAEAGVTYRVVATSGDVGAGPFDVFTADLDTGRLTIESGDLAIGAYRWRVTAADPAGNTADSDIGAFTMVANDWTATLTVSALLGGLPVSGGSVLEIGVAPGATEGFDVGLDVVAPLPSTSDAFILPHLFYPGNDPGPPDLRLLATSIVTPAMPQEWQLRVMASGDSGDTFKVALIWDVSAIPDNFKEVRLYGSGDGILLADMKTTGGYTFQTTVNGTGASAVDFRVRVGRFETQTLLFRQGWNLIALAIEPLDASPAEVLKDLGTFSIFEWRADNQAYGVPQLLAGRAGYWVAVFQQAEITFEGAAVGPYVGTMEKGWNLVGGTFDEAAMEVVSGGQVGTSLFRWDPDLQRYVSTTTMAPGFGHWLAAFDVAAVRVSPLGG